MNKKLAYQIEITLSTDGDFSFRKELLPPNFLNNDCREIIEFTEDTFKCNIYDKDMKSSGWSEGEWCKFIARTTFESYISAIHVGHTHLYIWTYLLECLDEIHDWLYDKEEKPNYCSSFIGGNYDGTEFYIRKIGD